MCLLQVFKQLERLVANADETTAVNRCMYTVIENIKTTDW